MWQLVINSPDQEPKLVDLRPGKLTIGRSSTNNIVIEDVAASRQHVEVLFNPATNTVTLTDLNSTNGTFVNRQRIHGSCQLNHDDLVRIGQVVFHVSYSTGSIKKQSDVAGTHRFTRELVLEALDEHSVLLYEILKRLNTVLDVSTAVDVVTELLKRALGVDYCEVVFRKELRELETSDLADPLAKQALRSRSAEVSPTNMFVPIMSGDDVLGLIAMHKSRPDSRPFDRRDLQLAVAISHQTALTIQRIELLNKVQREEQARRLLLRFVSPTEAEFLLKDYLTTGELPGLTEQKITVLFSDIVNSTGLAERLGTMHFGKILNNFYQTASEIVFRYHGMIKYLGDGVLGIFPEHDDGMLTEEKAVLAGRELTSLLNRTGSLDPDRRIIFGVSINTGPAMVGYVGTKERAEFNAMGDVVNVAYRMQEYARPYKVIVGPATVAAISHQFKFSRVGAVSLRGRENAIQVYEVLP
jgi:class 3 adenylate cyclase